MPLEIVTASPLLNAEKDQAYAAVIVATGGTNPHQWALVGGSLPPGLTLNTASFAASTTINGVPTSFGNFTFQIEVQDSLAQTFVKEFKIAVIQEPSLVSFNTRVIDPGTNLGVQLVGLTAEIYDVQHQLQDTLIFPVGISESQDGQGYLYSVLDFDISDQTKYNGNFLHVKYTATTAAGVQTYWEIVPLGNEQVPAIEPEFTPYCSIPEAQVYFQQRFDKRDRWNVFNERIGDQLTALVLASDQIDMERFKGRTYVFFKGANNVGQYLRQFPRYMPFGEQWWGYEGPNFIPPKIQWATCEQALWLMEQRQAGHDMQMRQFMQNSGLTGITRGSQSESWDTSKAQNGALCPDAYRLVQPFLANYVEDSPSGFGG